MEKQNNKIGIIGDLHLREFLGYSDYIEDGRVEEQEEVLNFIVKSFSDCDSIIFMGDQFHARSSSPHVVKKLVNLLERFDGKKIYILAGNHESYGTGKTSMDFLKEIKNKKWYIITDEVVKIENNVFCPYFTKAELETNDNKEASKKVMKKLVLGNILFVHHAISDTLNNAGCKVDIFPEAVLPKKKLEEKYNMIFGGHIHHPQATDKTIITGSIFNNEVGETQKYIWKLDEKTLAVEQIKLPGRGIYKVENPTNADLDKIEKNNIVKVIITKKISAPKLGELKEKIKKFDAYLLLEQIPHERKRMHFDKNKKLLEFSVDQLLETYSKMKEIDLSKLKQGFELIK